MYKSQFLIPFLLTLGVVGYGYYRLFRSRHRKLFLLFLIAPIPITLIGGALSKSPFNPALSLTPLIGLAFWLYIYLQQFKSPDTNRISLSRAAVGILAIVVLLATQLGLNLAFGLSYFSFIYLMFFGPFTIVAEWFMTEVLFRKNRIFACIGYAILAVVFAGILHALQQISEHADYYRRQGADELIRCFGWMMTCVSPLISMVTYNLFRLALDPGSRPYTGTTPALTPPPPPA